MANIPPGPPPPAPPDPSASDAPPPEPPFSPATPGRKLPPVAMMVIGVALVAGAVVGVLIARGGDKEDSGKAGPITVPAGWATQDLSSEGFTLALPPDWKVIPPGDVEPAVDELRAENPELADLIEGQLQGSLSQLVRFFAFDTDAPTLAQGFATNVNVVVEPLQTDDVAFAAYVDANIRNLKQVPGVTVTLKDDNLALPGGRAALINSEFTLNSADGVRKIDVTQYVMLRGRRGLILSMTTTPEHAATYAQTFTDIAKTFRPV